MPARLKKCTFRMTERELAELHRKAEIAGLKMEPFLRSLIDGCEIKPRPPDSYKDLARELSAIGNNINQITHLANSTGYVSSSQIEQLASLMMQVWQLVQERV